MMTDRNYMIALSDITREIRETHEEIIEYIGLHGYINRYLSNRWTMLCDAYNDAESDAIALSSVDFR
jgi:hypothetical protein